MSALARHYTYIKTPTLNTNTTNYKPTRAQRMHVPYRTRHNAHLQDYKIIEEGLYNCRRRGCSRLIYSSLCTQDWGSGCWRSRTMDGSLFAPSINSANDNLPSRFLSICLKILSVLFSGVLSSSGIFITLPTIL